MVRSVLSAARSRVAGASRHSSNAIITSTPSASCTSTDTSGVSIRQLPSSGDRILTPCSLTTSRSFIENTWYPPLSVSSGPLHRMNACRPPSERITSCPGRTHRW